jgi:hypothetical protein
VVDIFSNIELIARMHKDLYHGLEELQEDWPLICGVGQVFLAMVHALLCFWICSSRCASTDAPVCDVDQQAKNFENYGKYAENYYTSMNTLGVLADRKHRLHGTLEVCARVRY